MTTSSRQEECHMVYCKFFVMVCKVTSYNPLDGLTRFVCSGCFFLKFGIKFWLKNWVTNLLLTTEALIVLSRVVSFESPMGRVRLASEAVHTIGQELLSYITYLFPLTFLYCPYAFLHIPSCWLAKPYNSHSSV